MVYSLTCPHPLHLIIVTYYIICMGTPVVYLLSILVLACVYDMILPAAGGLPAGHRTVWVEAAACRGCFAPGRRLGAAHREGTAMFIIHRTFVTLRYVRCAPVHCGTDGRRLPGAVHWRTASWRSLSTRPVVTH